MLATKAANTTSHTDGGLAANVTSAKLRLYGNAQTTTKGTSVYSVGDVAWSESGITWNYPTTGAGGPAMDTPALATQSVSLTAGWVEWDVTNYVKNQRAGNATAVTFGVKSDVVNDDGPTIFNSKEGANKPLLIISSGP